MTVLPTESPLLDMQAPRGVPLTDQVTVTSDPLLPPQSSREMLAHFFEDLYDLRPESHLSRLLGVLLGDSGVGQLRKRFTYAHLSHTIRTAHFYDLDRFFADVFGFRRLFAERLPFDPYEHAGTQEEWEEILARDAAYQNRVAQFVRGINWGATKTGMHLVASAILSHPVRIYEMYHAIDDADTYDPETNDQINTYGDLEAYTYFQLNALAYSEVEGVSAYVGRANSSRTEFIVRPLRPITAEEKYHLTVVLNRLKPAASLVTIDPTGVQATQPVTITGVSSPSSHWQIQQRVVADPSNQNFYAVYLDGEPAEQPRPVFSGYQGGEWYHNQDVEEISAYAVQDDEVVQTSNYERVVGIDTGDAVDYIPRSALVQANDIHRGRIARDGVAVASVARRAST